MPNIKDLALKNASKQYLKTASHASTFSILHHLIGVWVGGSALFSLVKQQPKVALPKHLELESKALSTLPHYRYGDAIQQQMAKALYTQQREKKLIEDDWTYPYKTEDQKNESRMKFDEQHIESHYKKAQWEQNHHQFFKNDEKKLGMAESVTEAIKQILGK